MDNSATFVGQKRIWKELDIEIPAIVNGTNVNYLVKAPSGYGKTLLASMLIYRLGYPFYYTIPDDEGKVKLDLTKKVICIDEIHYMKQPETLYPLMDSNKYIFIICTNESGVLKEALTRRCIPLIFDDYTLGELALIAKNYFISYGLEIEDEVAYEIAKNSHTPGNIVIICKRLQLVFETNGVVKTRDAVKEIMEDTLNVKNGLTSEHQKYIEFLSRIQTASLDTLVNGLSLDRGTITRIIEPELIKKGLLLITSRGRKLREL